jgi:3-deoxy-D-manno-octulosonic-acid transferase
MRLIYSFGIRCFGWAMRLASPFHPKAKRMVAGRKNWRKNLGAATAGWENTIWFHCASLGEFEQGRSLIEAIRAKHPHRKILLSFFSPSGYEIRKHYAQADHVCYLPLDTPANAADFLRIAKPSMAVFVKYDLWLNLLRACDQNRIPVVLVSALVDAQSNFLKSALRGEYRKAFAAMHWVFTQDQNSKDLLAAFCGTDRISVAGDTRFDRAAQLPESFVPIVGIAEFIKGRTCIVAGSPWPKDEEILLPCIEKMRSKDVCWIIAPHEIHAGRHPGKNCGVQRIHGKIQQLAGGG